MHNIKVDFLYRLPSGEVVTELVNVLGSEHELRHAIIKFRSKLPEDVEFLHIKVRADSVLSNLN